MEIEAIVDVALASGLGSAAAVSIGDAGREVIRVVRGCAYRDGPPIDERTRFDVASLTKPMATAAIAMALVGEHRLGLGDLVATWLPGAATRGSVQELFAHAAGCAAHVEFFRALRAAPPPDPYGALVRAAMEHPVVAPGVTAVYSDLGYLQAGAVVEAASGRSLREAFADLVTGPLGLDATGYGPIDPATAVATELDDRGLVRGRVHDENAYHGGDACGHAGVFSTIGDVATFAAAICDTLAGDARGRFVPEVVRAFVTATGAPGASWRMGWDTPSCKPGVSHAGDRWPREHAIGHLGFTGTSIWLDPPRRRWSIILTNRVHPTRGGDSADRIKAFRRRVNDAAIELTDRSSAPDPR